jgi:long-chain acyl-CoA synthetase
VTALVTLDPEAITAWGQAQGHPTSPYEDFVSSPVVHDLIESDVAQANKKLERWETIKRFEILPSELSVDDGEVTPSLKIRRKAVEQKHAEVLAGMYERD